MMRAMMRTEEADLMGAVEVGLWVMPEKSFVLATVVSRGGVFDDGAGGSFKSRRGLRQKTAVDQGEWSFRSGSDTLTSVSPARNFRVPLLCAAQLSDILLLQGRPQIVALQQLARTERFRRDGSGMAALPPCRQDGNGA
jgi:hypothetical protein